MLKPDAPALSLYAQIKSDIEMRITSGAWPSGARIPSEHALMAEYNCARMTVNRALAALAQQGKIVRRRRAGSFVSQPQLQAGVVTIPDIAAIVRARGQTYSHRVIAQHTRAPHAERPYEHALAQKGLLIALHTVHEADAQPFALERRLISLKAAPLARNVVFAQHEASQWLLQHVLWTKAQHTIRAAAANARCRQYLLLRPGAACLVLERRTYKHAMPVTWVEQYFAAGTLDLCVTFGSDVFTAQEGI